MRLHIVVVKMHVVVVSLIMPRAEAYGSSFVCLSVSHYAEGGATEAYCNRAVCQSVCLLQVFLVAH